MKMIEYNILVDHSSGFIVSAAEIENTTTYITGSIADMQSILTDVDENIPKEEEAFLKIDDERVRADCNFRKVCD